MGNSGSPLRVFDIARSMVSCENFTQHVSVIEFVTQQSRVGEIDITRAKQRYASASPGGWRDIMVNFFFRGDQTCHICELQIVHTKLLLLRASGGGHDDYDVSRVAAEFYELVVGEIAYKKFLRTIPTRDVAQKTMVDSGTQCWT